MNSTIQSHIATLRDYVEHSTHWKEGGATRHDALLALGALGADVAAPYKPAAEQACWACNGTRAVTTSSNGSGLIEADCLACTDDEDGRCPTCGEDGGTSCGMPNCGLLTQEDSLAEFSAAWARMEAASYRYGDDALEQVRMGWRLARGEL